jgi:3' exoribonuclease, RNase T-like
MSEQLHLMVDLETTATRPGACIVSIGAIFFTREKVVGNGFYVDLDWRHQADEFGMEVDPDTMDWWVKQPAPARLALDSPYAKKLGEGLNWLSGFVPKIAVPIWCRGASFDFPILSEAYRRAGLVVPWRYHQERDVRTVLSAACNYGLEKQGGEAAHHALADAEVQAWALINFWNGRGV